MGFYRPSGGSNLLTSAWTCYLLCFSSSTHLTPINGFAVQLGPVSGFTKYYCILGVHSQCLLIVRFSSKTDHRSFNDPALTSVSTRPLQIELLSLSSVDLPGKYFLLSITHYCFLIILIFCNTCLFISLVKIWLQCLEVSVTTQIVGWHHRFNGHKFEQTPGDSQH